MDETDPQFQRIDAIVGAEESLRFGQQLDRFFEYLKSSLALPCEVTGIEDFRWEEFYVLGPGDRRGYALLKKTQPSYRDRFELLEIKQGVYSEWLLFYEDIGARVRRKTDGREFWLGLAELKAVERNSPNYQLLDDYATFFVNYRE